MMHFRTAQFRFAESELNGEPRPLLQGVGANGLESVGEMEEVGASKSQRLIPFTMVETDAMKQIAQFLMTEEFLTHYADQRQEWIRRANSIYHGACFVEEQLKQGETVWMPEEMADLADFARSLPAIESSNGRLNWHD